MKGALETLKCRFITEGESTGEHTEDGNLLIDGVFPSKADVHMSEACVCSLFTYSKR